MPGRPMSRTTNAPGGAELGERPPRRSGARAPASRLLLEVLLDQPADRLVVLDEQERAAGRRRHLPRPPGGSPVAGSLSGPDREHLAARPQRPDVRGPAGPTTRVRGRRGSRRSCRRAPGARAPRATIDVITPRSTRKSFVPPSRSATTTSERIMCGPKNRSISARGSAKPPWASQKKLFTATRTVDEQGEAAAGHAHMIVQRSDEDVKPA